jgi:hypothetical protein
MTVKEIKQLIDEVGYDSAIKWCLDVGYMDVALYLLELTNYAEFKLYTEQLT